MAENEVAPDDVAADVAAAIEKLDKAPEPVAEVIASEPIGEVKETAAEAKARDEKGRFAPKIGDKAPDLKKEVKATEQPPKAEARVEPPTPPTEPIKPERMPPRSLPAPLREAWGKLGDVERDFLMKREGEVAKLMTDSAQARQIHERFQKEIYQPHEQVFRSENVDPITGTASLINTYATLRNPNTPHQIKAQTIANLIRMSGTPIEILDATLAGQPASAQPPQQMYDPSYIDQRAQQAALAAIESLKAKTYESQAQTAYDEFMSDPPEFFEDVQADMEKLLRAGIATDYKDAYDTAVYRNPAVKRVMEQRRAAATSSGAMQRSVAAASSVKATPASVAPVITGGSIEDDVRAAVERLSRSR